ncbi:CobW family GTP-binding protein [Cohnella boryungensis]|uniref:CobW family GTP-binding protein n=1 Tax=Cohnella boryungensis TaxID=768479 RepID=A0ABV8SGQ6_9BACL
MDKIVPVYVLTGFLGSGKTTLLNRVLEEAASGHRKIALLMNEVGDANVEGGLLEQDVPMAEMLGGCICCTIRADLGMELSKLAREHRPDAIWIETTGIARPLEILDSVTEASMYERLELKGVIAVADARHLLDRIRVGAGKTYKLMREQISAADLVVLNKTDLVGATELDELQSLLEVWSPNAVKVSTVRTQVDLEEIYRLNHVSASDLSRSDSRTCSSDCELDHAHEHQHEHQEHHGKGASHDHVHALTYYLPGPVDSHAFEALVSRLPEDVYRAKGIVTFRDTASRFLFQYAYRESDYLRITPQKTVYDVVVFIGEGFSKQALLRELEQLTEV